MNKTKEIPWRVDSDNRDCRRAYIGPNSFYIEVRQYKDDAQWPVGTPIISLAGGNISIEAAEQIIKALQDGVELARKWEAEAQPALAKE